MIFTDSLTPDTMVCLVLAGLPLLEAGLRMVPHEKVVNRSGQDEVAVPGLLAVIPIRGLPTLILFFLFVEQLAVLVQLVVMEAEVVVRDDHVQSQRRVLHEAWQQTLDVFSANVTATADLELLVDPADAIFPSP